MYHSHITKDSCISPKDENAQTFVMREWLSGVSTFFASPLYKLKRFLNGYLPAYHDVLRYLCSTLL